MTKQRNTIQKKIILDIVCSDKKHLTADEIYQRVITTHPNISRATVFRNLKNMTYQGLIKKLEISGSADRYDCIDNHYHAKCIKCGEINDLTTPYLNDLDTKVNCNLDILGHDIIFKTVCGKCQKRKGEIK